MSATKPRGRGRKGGGEGEGGDTEKETETEGHRLCKCGKMLVIDESRRVYRCLLSNSFKFSENLQLKTKQQETSPLMGNTLFSKKPVLR